MSDDDDYERRRGNRDKFAKERTTRDFSDNRGNRYPRPTPPDFPGSYNRRPRPDMNTPMAKRPRRDWGEDTYDPQPRSRDGEKGGMGSGMLMSFKQFLATQDDSITDEDAIAKYQEYKTEHKRQQLHNFFVEHKDEEWFKLKYQPEESAKQREDHLERVKRRLEVFERLHEEGWIDRAHLTHSNGKHQIRCMDALVVKLEGGTDEELRQLQSDDEEDPVDSSKNTTNETSKLTKSSSDQDSSMDKSGESEEGETKEKKEEKEEKEEEKKEEEEESEEAKKERKAREEDGALSDSESEKEDKKPEAPSTQRKKITPPQSTEEPSMHLHKTASIFLRNIAPNITKNEVETLCKKYEGFLRVGLADPLPERKYYRRGWVSYRRDVNIKEICWNLNNVRIRDCDLGAIVNRDLTRRVRTVNGLSVHKPIAQNDLRMASKLVQIYDKKNHLYQDEEQNGNGETHTAQNLMKMEYGLQSKNPLLQNITDYLIEEASAEEDELLGMATGDGTDQKVPIERDDSIFKVLDRIVLYLRLVHSVDYYNCGEYPHEDEMPNRCGLIHVRGPPITEATQSFINEYTKSFENRISPLLNPVDKILDEDAEKLGKKDPEKEVQAFITANCQELAKDKWLCPLSGKKFKGPEFVRKHILNKHGEKLDEVRVEVSYFNNYIYDPKRPGGEDPKPPLMTPLASSSSLGSMGPPSYSTPTDVGGSGGGGYNRPHYSGGGAPHYHHDRSHPPPLMGGPPSYSGGSGGGDYRPGWRGGYGRDSYGGGPPRRDFTPRYNRGGGGGPGFDRSYDSGPMGGGSGARTNKDGTPSSFRRRDPRELTSYKDLDAPEDTY